MSPLYDRSGRDLSEALDRHITGNWGEDQFGPMLTCPECGEQAAHEPTEGMYECEACGEEGELITACSNGRCRTCDRCEEAAERKAEDMLEARWADDPGRDEW